MNVTFNNPECWGTYGVLIPEWPLPFTELLPGAPDVVLVNSCHECGKLPATASAFRNHLTSTRLYFSTLPRCQQNAEDIFYTCRPVWVVRGCSLAG